MRLRRLLMLAVFMAPVGLVGCNSNDIPKATKNGEIAPSVKPSVDVGPPLFEAKSTPKIAPVLSAAVEPLVIPNCTVSFEERQQVASEVDGKIEMIATPLPADKPFDPADPTIIFHPRDPEKKRPFRRLRDGDPVALGQILCIMDDQIVNQKMKASTTIRAASEEVKTSAEKGVKLSEDKYALTLKAYQSGSIGYAELVNDQITLSRFQENLAQSKQSIAKAEADYNESYVMLGKHQVKSNVNGFVRNASRRAGEFVKQGEKIMELQATDIVRVEGNLDVQYAAALKRGMVVTFEPALPAAPHRSRDWHRQEVTGIAVTANKDRPLVISVGADGAAVVWDVTRDQTFHNLPHPVPVHSVACTPASADLVYKGRAITGADDGKIRIWDLSNPDKIATTPMREGSEAHATAVQAIAFSPNGQYFATAAGRDIFLWETESGRKLYALPAEHRDIVTSLTITPQSTLVSTSRDRSLKVWNLGRERGSVARSLDHRSGAVDKLAVSNDGSRVLFDQDRDRLDVIGLSDMQTIAQIQSSGSNAAFATFALYNPDDSMIVTGGGEGDLKGGVQIWTAPSPGTRGAELARLIAPAHAPITCAAFSPDPTHRFLVVGTAEGGVHLWTPPQNKTPSTITGTITKIDATDTRYNTIRGEFPNKLDLRDRSAGTMIIQPAP